MKKSIIIIILLFPVFVSAQANLIDIKPGLTPDSSFYFLDTWGKRINLFFTFSPEKKAEKSLKFAEEKIAEAIVMADKNKTNAVEIANKKYQEFINLANQKTKEAEEKGTNIEELASLITEKTLRHQEVLIEIFEKVPEEAKSAIEKAIQVSRGGTEEAVKSVSGERKEEFLQKIEEVKNKIDERMITLEEKIEKLEQKLEEKSKTEIDNFKKETEKIKNAVETKQSETEKETRRLAEEQRKQEELRKQQEAQRLLEQQKQQELLAQQQEYQKQEAQRLADAQRLAEEQRQKEIARQQELERQKQLEQQRLAEEKQKQIESEYSYYIEKLNIIKNRLSNEKSSVSLTIKQLSGLLSQDKDKAFSDYQSALSRAERDYNLKLQQIREYYAARGMTFSSERSNAEAAANDDYIYTIQTLERNYNRSIADIERYYSQKEEELKQSLVLVDSKIKDIDYLIGRLQQKTLSEADKLLLNKALSY